MTIGTLGALGVAGIKRGLMEALTPVEPWWEKHCTKMDAKTEVVPFGWAGAVPQPRPMVDGRRIREIRSFTYNIENQTYELTVLIPRKWIEDDQTGAIKLRVAEIAQAFLNYKPWLFTQMLENGATAGHVGYDGLTFFNDAHSEGDSGTVDNDFTSVAAAADAVPTSAEFLAQMGVIKAAMWRYLNDVGVPINIGAMPELRVIIPPESETPVREALHATQLSGTTNVIGPGMAEVDQDSFLTYSGTTCTMFVHAVGAPFKGIIYQQRTPLEVVMYDDERWYDSNDGLLVTLRERFVFAYGLYQRMGKQVFTT